jgi:hypothetical protein
MTYLGVSLVTVLLTVSCAAAIDRAEAAVRAGAVATRSEVATDISAAHRSRRSNIRRHRRARVYVHSRPYARPAYDVPKGQAPFFPFGFGYGLDPSW